MRPRLKLRGSVIEKFLLIVAGLLILLLVVQSSLGAILLPRINRYLETFSPTYIVHIDKMSTNFFRMAYTFEGVDGKLKDGGKRFLQIRYIDVSISWWELFHLRVLTDVVAERGFLDVTKPLVSGSTAPQAKPKEDALNLAHTLFPVDVEHVHLYDMNIRYNEMVSQPASELWTFSVTEGNLSNLTPTKAEPYTDFAMSGRVMKDGRLRLDGEAMRLEKPMAWKSNIELRDFPLAAADPALVAWVPVSFAKGTLDIYAEARSRSGKIDGYVKPFFRHVKVFKNPQKLKNVKHFFMDVLTAAANLILRRHDDKTVAAKIPFHSENGSISFGTQEAISTAFENGFGERLTPGLENSIKL